MRAAIERTAMGEPPKRGGILAFDGKAAMVWAEPMAETRVWGRWRSEHDMSVAAIVVANGCIGVADNERDLEGVDLINPMRDRRT